MRVGPATEPVQTARVGDSILYVWRLQQDIV